MHKLVDTGSEAEMVAATRWLGDKLSEMKGLAVVEVNANKSNRSLAQNRLYWKWLGEMSQEMGFSVNQLHKFLKYELLGYEIELIQGEMVRELRSTTKLKVKEMSDYMTKVEAMAAEQGIALTRPDDYELAIYGAKK